MPTPSRYKPRYDQPIDFEIVRNLESDRTAATLKDTWDNSQIDDAYGHSFDKDYTSPKPQGQIGNVLLLTRLMCLLTALVILICGTFVLINHGSWESAVLGGLLSAVTLILILKTFIDLIS